MPRPVVLTPVLPRLKCPVFRPGILSRLGRSVKRIDQADKRN